MSDLDAALARVAALEQAISDHRDSVCAEAPVLSSADLELWQQIVEKK